MQVESAAYLHGHSTFTLAALAAPDTPAGKTAAAVCQVQVPSLTCLAPSGELTLSQQSCSRWTCCSLDSTLGIPLPEISPLTGPARQRENADMRGCDVIFN